MHDQLHAEKCQEKKIAVKENIQEKIASLQEKIVSFKIILLLNNINIYGKTTDKK